MSRNVCAHRGKKLPDNTTCGGMCADFPACLPPSSPELIESIRASIRLTSADHDRRRAIRSTLDAINGAIGEGTSENGECGPTGSAGA